eukprot:4339734-Pyramimonas_sp.AAC.1
MALEHPQRAPCRFREAPKTASDGQGAHQERRPKMALRWPKTAQEAPKRSPKRPQRPPRVPPGRPEEANIIDFPKGY